MIQSLLKLIGLAALVAVLVAVVLSVFEGTIFFVYRSPSLVASLPYPLRAAMIRLYTFHDRVGVETWGAWNSEVTYTIRPRLLEFPIHGPEFNVSISANSAGFRDLESALADPRILVLGDSFAEGHAVEPEQTFASLLGHAVGMKVLNAGIPSYGTAREVITANRRLDTAEVKFIVIQYCENDVDENIAFVAGNGLLAVTGQKAFESDAQLVRNELHYRPLKWSRLFVRELRAVLRGDPRGYAPPDVPRSRLQTNLEHAYFFLESLKYLKPKNSRAKLIVFDLYDRSDDLYLGRRQNERRALFDSTGFTRAIRTLLQGGSYPSFLKEMVVLDSSKFVRQADSDYFLVDGHLRPSAHLQVAEALAQVVIGGRSPYEAGTPLNIPQQDLVNSLFQRSPLPSNGFKSKMSCLNTHMTLTTSELERVSARLQITNAGLVPWPRLGAPHEIHVRPHLLTSDGRVINYDVPVANPRLPYSVLPGETVSMVQVANLGKQPAGQYRLVFDLVQEGVAWFADRGGVQCEVVLNVR